MPGHIQPSSNFGSCNPRQKGSGPLLDQSGHRFAFLSDRSGVPRHQNSPIVLLCESLPRTSNPYNRVTPSMIAIGYIDNLSQTLWGGEGTSITIPFLIMYTTQNSSRLHAFGRNRLHNTLKVSTRQALPSIVTSNPEVYHDVANEVG